MRAVNVDSFFAAPRGYDLELQAFSQLGVSLELLTLRTPEELVRGAAEADIVLVEHPTTRFSREVIESLPRCRLIAKYGVGLDNIDLEAATERGIVVCHSPDYCVEEVSDHALALLLACARRIFLFDRHVRLGGWSGISLDPPIRRLRDETVGLLGFGRIARRVAEKLSGWKMRVLAFDPYVSPQAFAALGVEAVPFPSLLAQSHYLSLHLPLNRRNYHLLGKEEFQRMPRNAFLVNTSRGAIVDEAELIDALRRGRLAGAALDVTEEEPLPASHPLRTMPNVLVTPHFGARSEEAVEHLRTAIVQSVAAFSAGFRPPFVANPEAARGLRPYGEWCASERLA